MSPSANNEVADRHQQRSRDDDRDTDSADSHDEQSKPGKKSLLQRPGVLIVGGILLVVLIVGGLLWWLHARKYENTDDAFVDARVVRVSPRVSGQVTAVHVTDNQLVQAGDPLVDIDPADIQASLDQAKAQKAQAETALGQSQADVLVSQAQLAQTAANAAAADAQAVNAAQDLKRYLDLKASTPEAVAQGQIDQATAQARSSAAQRDAARQQVRSAAAQVEAAKAAVAGAQAKLETAVAQLKQADLNFGYTRVTAAVAGHIARRTVSVGAYVAPGQQMLAIVPLQVWITANFKETQLALMRIGQSVLVHVDACPGVDLEAHVDSIQRGAGQAFALLPPENATGNYVKVVQRVPVKIVLNQESKDCPLGPGMSVEPRVQVR